MFRMPSLGFGPRFRARLEHHLVFLSGIAGPRVGNQDEIVGEHRVEGGPRNECERLQSAGKPPNIGMEPEISRK